MSLRIIVGLGNPGSRYEGTRHNVGFRVIDALSKELGICVDQKKWKSLVGEGRFQGQKILLVKPQTFMNLSGEAVREVLNFYKAPPSDVLVLLDDVDIHLGTIRVRANGSSGTHNGLRNIVKELGSEDFARIRVSIGRRPAQMDMAAFVLSRFSEDDEKTVGEEVQAAAKATLQYLSEGATAAMNAWNGWKAPSVQILTSEQKKQQEQSDALREKQDEFRKHAKRCGE